MPAPRLITEQAQGYVLTGFVHSMGPVLKLLASCPNPADLNVDELIETVQAAASATDPDTARAICIGANTADPQLHNFYLYELQRHMYRAVFALGFRNIPASYLDFGTEWPGN